MRYILLVCLNLPIILVALLNIVTQYKMKKISPERFKYQLLLWLVILIVLTSSFPIYNYVRGDAILDSSKLSLFDIAQTTVIVYLIYIINNQRRKIEQVEKFTRDLHQEVSIRLSKK